MTAYVDQLSNVSLDHYDITPNIRKKAIILGGVFATKEGQQTLFDTKDEK